jgi:hypothetical protein
MAQTTACHREVIRFNSGSSTARRNSRSNSITAVRLRQPPVLKWDHMQMYRGFALFLRNPEPPGDGTAALLCTKAPPI